MLVERLINFQRENNIELEWNFKGSGFIVYSACFAEFAAPLIFNDLDLMFKKILQLKEMKEVSMESNVFALNSFLKVKEDDFVEENEGGVVLQFPIKESRKPRIELEASDPNELARAVLCINNLRKPITDQDEEYRNLHKDGISSFKNFKEL